MDLLQLPGLGAAVRSGGGSAGGPEDFSPKHTTGAALPAWAATDLARLKVPRQTLHPVVTTLANGLKLIVVPTSASDTVSVYGRVKQARELAWPKGLEGIDFILDQVFNAGGTATLDAAAFEKASTTSGPWRRRAATSTSRPSPATSIARWTSSPPRSSTRSSPTPRWPPRARP